MKSQQKSGRSQMERRRRRREKFVEIFVCRWSRGSSRECVKSKGGTYRRRGRFEVPRKRRAGAPLRHWPVRRGLAPVKREDLLWLLVVPSLSVLHHLDGGCLVPFRPQFHASLSLSLSLWSFTITKRKTSRPINCRHASNKGSFVPLLVVLHHFFPPFFSRCARTASVERSIDASLFFPPPLLDRKVSLLLFLPFRGNGGSRRLLHDTNDAECVRVSAIDGGPRSTVG